MIYRLIGAALIVLSCSAMGFCMAASHKREVRLLQGFLTSVQYMKSELQYRCIPLPELCSKTALVSDDIVAQFFSLLSKNLITQVYSNPVDCAQSAIKQLKNAPATLTSVMQTFSGHLGMFNLEGQVRALERTANETQDALKKLSQDQEVRMRSYQTLGICAGAALAILLV